MTDYEILHPENDEFVTENANAKINICLDAEYKRDDGYHEISSIVVPLTLHDTIEIRKAKRMSYHCNDKSLPFDDTNTVVQAVKLMKNTFHIKDNYHITVHKEIPQQAGLGGGSSDAAAVMRGILALSHPPTNYSYLEEMAIQIGADVPSLISKRCVYVSGIGEHLHYLDNHFHFYVLLIKPEIGVSTKAVYENLDLKTCPHPDVYKCWEEWDNKNLDGVLANCGNSLEGSTFQLVKEVADLKQELMSYGFQLVSMTGSGTTVFAIGGMGLMDMYRVSEKMQDRYPYVEIYSNYPQMYSRETIVNMHYFF